MLKLTRLHLGIAHESQFQGLGISLFLSVCTNSSVEIRIRIRRKLVAAVESHFEAEKAAV